MAKQVPKLLLYKHDASPPSVAVKILADILDLKLDYKEPNLLELEQKSVEFKKINPIGTIPVLQDDDFVVSQSHAIIKYLLSKYGADKQEKLYPSDIRTRAIIDQCLFFDASVLFVRLKAVAIPTLFQGSQGPTPQNLADIEEAYSVIEAYLQNHKYIAADNFTIADISVGSTAASLHAMYKFDVNKYPRSVEWLALLNKESCFQNASGGFDLFGNLMHTLWEKNKQ